MKENKGWCYVITGPDGDEFDSFSRTKDGAWERFCYPALRREAYEAKDSGFRVKRVSVKKVLAQHFE